MGSSNISGEGKGSRRNGSNDGRRKSSSEEFSDNSRDFKAILFAILSPEGMKPPVLKNLYRVLLQLSSNSQWVAKHAAGSHDFDLDICYNGIEVAFQDILKLSDVLFKELDERFDQLFSNFCHISASKDLGESSSGLSPLDTSEVTILLFRCCMVLLSLLGPQQKFLSEKGGILFRVLRKLSLTKVVQNTGKHGFVFENSVFRECSPGNNGCSTSSVEDFTASLQFLEPSNPLYFILSTMLEVSVDELLANEQLRGYFKILNSISSMDKILFNPNSDQGDIAIVMEAICSHFILSFSDTQAFGDFLELLFCAHAKDLKYPFRELGLGVTAAVSLFLSPIMASVPKYMQAHLYLLVSEAIDFKRLKPDLKLSNCFLSILEKSVILYMRHMSCFPTDLYSAPVRDFKPSSPHDVAHPSYELYILPETKHKVDSLVTKLDKSSDRIMNDCCLRTKSDLVNSSMRFVKECQSDYAISCKEEVMVILSCLVLKASECYNDKAVRPIEGRSLQQLYLLSSLLRLMSISLIRSIWCFRHKDDFCSMKTLKDFSSCKEYDFVLGVISCFRDLDIHLPLQKDLSSVILNHSTQHMDSKMMFLHFSGLMSLSFGIGLDCLVKACLLTILALLNLFVFEEGNLDGLQSFVDSNKNSFSSELSVVRLQQTVVDQNASLVVASKFQKLRSLCSSRSIESNNNDMEPSRSQTSTCVTHLEEETEETTNGEIFFRAMLRTEGNVSDFDDLVNFVECKQGKDYSSWLKNRQKFRRWRSEKMAVLKWKKKKKTRKTLKVN